MSHLIFFRLQISQALAVLILFVGTLESPLLLSLLLAPLEGEEASDFGETLRFEVLPLELLGPLAPAIFDVNQSIALEEILESRRSEIDS